jgi:hypothetical protein
MIKFSQNIDLCRQNLLEEERIKRKVKTEAQETAILEKKNRIDSYKNNLWGFEIRNSQEILIKLNQRSKIRLSILL